MLQPTLSRLTGGVRVQFLAVCALASLTAGQLLAAGEPGIHLADTYQPGDFRLVDEGKSADVLIDSGDFKVDQIAAADLVDDVHRVTGVSPRLVNQPPSLSDYAVFIGTLGRSPVIDNLAKAGKIDSAAIAGQWESFLIQVVADPAPGVKFGLVIAGSDRRGTAYGVFELSECIGVSPWVWWADVAPRTGKA